MVILYFCENLELTTLSRRLVLPTPLSPRITILVIALRELLIDLALSITSKSRKGMINHLKVCNKRWKQRIIELIRGKESFCNGYFVLILTRLLRKILLT